MEIQDEVAKALEKIRETLASSKAQQIIKKPLDEREKAKHRRRWLDLVIKLKANHPQLKHLENSIYDFCMEYKEQPDRGRRLLIYGENGSGKSHTSKAVSRWAKSNAFDFKWVVRKDSTDCESRPPRCMFRNWTALLSDLKGGFKNGSYSEMLDEALMAELLILDDVGADNDPSKFGVEQLYMLLEGRENRWTIITTNIGPNAWGDRFERRIESRFLRNFTHVALDEVPDYNTTATP